MLRGEDMALCDVYIQTQAGFDVLHSIGEIGCVQFIDMNWQVSPIHKHYVTDLCRCADMEQNLDFMREELTKEGIFMPRLRNLSYIKPLHPTEMFEFENMIDAWTKDVKDMSTNYMNLKKLKSETKEIHYVLNHLDLILGDVETGHTKLPRKMSPHKGVLERRQLKIVTGVVERSTSYHFQTMLWRISHGNIYYKEASHDKIFQNPFSGRDVRKVAFVIICHGDELHQRILKVCNGFNVRLYRWPEKHDDRLTTIQELSSRMQDMDKVLQRTNYQRAVTFENIAREWETWLVQVMKAKAIYYQLNLFNIDITSNTMIGQCWLPVSRYDEVELALESTSEMVGARSFMVRTMTDIIPPTHYRTNKFTEVFQSIISCYQIGRYKELNPGIFAIVSFPFFFGVMFGDVGHGLILFFYASWMINNEKKYMYRASTNELWDLIFKGRYMILLMGLFAIFMGFLYNDWFSLTSKMMPPYWLNTYNTATLEDYEDEEFELTPSKGSVGYVYKYGIDPGIKFMSVNGYSWEISVKMKLSIILGVVHIVIGLLMSMWNYAFFRKYYAIFLHFLPKLIFMLSIYGLLCYWFFLKWLHPHNIKKFKTTFPTMYRLDFRPYSPNLRDEFLYFILWSQRAEPHKLVQYFVEHLKWKQSEFDYNLQHKIILHHLALACFPVLLFGSPIYLYIKNRIRESRIERKDSSKASQMRGEDSEELKKHQDFRLGPFLLHRLWRTLEFGLATVSHMASYLRLWAISLAHALLADFLWKEMMRKLALRDFTYDGIWKVAIFFFCWALLTLFFLVVIDGLAVFIHVLRLHWIEFMSKFFKGDGIPFLPFKLSTAVDDRDVKREKEIAAICKLRRATESAGDY